MLLISQNFFQNKFENNVQADFLRLLSQEDNGPFDTKDEGIKTPLGEPTYVVSYPHTAASWSIGQRIADLVDCPTKVLVTGVASDALPTLAFPNGIKDNGGRTYGLMLFPTGEDGATEDWVYIFYDVTDCKSQRYHAYNVKNEEILMPPFGILYHELCHAWHLHLQDAPSDINKNEAQAIGDENEGRLELLADPSQVRDPLNLNGGCGYHPPASRPDPNPWKGIGCFVATAAGYGTQDIIELTKELLEFRDHYFRRTPAGSTFFLRLWDEYYQYSPTIARLLRENARSASTVRDIFVEPLVHFIRWLRTYLTSSGCNDAWKSLTEKLSGSYDIVERYGGHGKVVEALEGLVVEPRSGIVPAFPFARRFDISDFGDLLNIVNGVMARAGCTPISRWSLVYPPILYWKWSRARLSGELSLDSIVADTTDWLQAAPPSILDSVLSLVRASPCGSCKV